MFNLSFVLTFLAIFIVAVLVGNYIAIDGDELSKSKKIYYKTKITKKQYRKYINKYDRYKSKERKNQKINQNFHNELIRR